MFRGLLDASRKAEAALRFSKYTFYFVNGNPKNVKTYFNIALMSVKLFLPSGKKRKEMSKKNIVFLRIWRQGYIL